MSDTPEVSSVDSLQEVSGPLEGVVRDEVVAASQPYIGQWNQLVSTTNWEKGRIIVEWRGALIDSSAPASEYADEAWARLVGGVTGQHVGRLRRVSQRFGRDYANFNGLYWSHFQAALDWDDAEMWLEGAVQSDWSVSQMRKQRWETLGALAGQEPQAEDVVASELDEDFEPAQTQDPIPNTLTASVGEFNSGPTHEGPDFGDEDAPTAPGDKHPTGDESYATDDASSTQTPVERVRPFESLGDLPDDVVEAFENFKLVILKHRREAWQGMQQADLVAALEALKQLALAPPDDQPAPF